MARFSITTAEPLTFDLLRRDALVADVGHPDEPFYVRLVSRDGALQHERAKSLQGRRVRITFETLDDETEGSTR